MSDTERAAVGTCYKRKGQQAAIELGHELVSGELKAQRLSLWQRYIDEHPTAMLYCFRGGLRSRTTVQWLLDSGYDIPLIKGGYKAMRGFLLSSLHSKIKEGHIHVLCGPTGSGKTDVIRQIPSSVDLERLANHRGSAFGSVHARQPAQIDFENRWAIEWLKLAHASQTPVLFEDESRLIGRISVLPEFLALSKHAPNVVVREAFDKRISRIRKDYFEQAFAHSLALSGDTQGALVYLNDFIKTALERIQKRLGGLRFQTLMQLLTNAIDELKSQNNWNGFDDIIAVLLTDYYDPMYDYQFHKKTGPIVFVGSHEEILQWQQSK